MKINPAISFFIHVSIIDYENIIAAHAVALLVLFTTTLAVAQVGKGDTPQADARIRKALAEAGVDFEVDSDADLKWNLNARMAGHSSYGSNQKPWRSS